MRQEHEAPISHDLRNAAILVVDDEEEIRLALDRVLTARFPDVQVFLAQDAAAALQALRTRPFRVVISDYRLRGTIDGAQLLRRAAEIQPGAALMALAADPDQYLVELGRQEGFMVLTKPIDETLFVRLLRHDLQPQPHATFGTPQP